MRLHDATVTAQMVRHLAEKQLCLDSRQPHMPTATPKYLLPTRCHIRACATGQFRIDLRLLWEQLNLRMYFSKNQHHRCLLQTGYCFRAMNIQNMGP